MKLNDQLALFLEQRAPQGLSYDDAAQLCLYLFATTGDLPPELRSGLSKEVLADTFSELTRRGWVKDAQGPYSALYGANFHAASDRGHWIEVIASMFKKGKTLRDEGMKASQSLLKGHAV